MASEVVDSLEINQNRQSDIESVWKRPSSRQILKILTICFGLALIAFAFLGNKMPFGRHEEEVSKRQFAFREKRFIQNGPSEEEVREAIFKTIDTKRIASTLRLLTKEPHVSGTEANLRVAQNIAQLWHDNGLEEVKMLEYDVLLSYPDWTSPNHAYVIADDGEVLFKSKGLSPDLLPHDGGGNGYQASIQWLAYSVNGTVEGEPIYCHYGRNEDFERLEKEFGISSLEGKIAIMRYSQIYRGDKVVNAQARGAIGAILFSDAAEVAWLGQEAVFPHTDQLPSMGVQRGAVNEFNGDALSPLLPARKEFYKERNIEEVIRLNQIPSIPVMPMGYGEVRQILSRMDGRAVPKEWQGGLNFTYHLGPGFRVGQGQKLRVEVKSSLEIKTIQNVIGIIPGREEPDSWVLLGNHYDAWVFGSIDPNSGTAVLAEVARAFVETHRTTGWRPRRTLVFCAWDGEEHALAGSTEFVEEFAELLRDRAIVYMNVDLISGNQTLDVLTVPSMYRAVIEAARKVEHPMYRHATLYDLWRYHFGYDNEWDSEVPKMKLPGGASDYMHFLNFLGMPVIDFSFRNASWKAMNGYSLYHSRYEVPFVNEHIFDHNNLAVHKAVGQFWAELARSFADSPLLPISASIFARKLLDNYLADVKNDLLQLASKFPEEMAPAMQQMSHLERQTQRFQQQAFQFEFHSAISEPGWANRRLQKLDQCFTNPVQGIAETDPQKRHVLFSLSADDTYTTTVMAAAYQKMGKLAKEQNEGKRKELGRQLALQLTVVQYSVLCATNLLKPFL